MPPTARTTQPRRHREHGVSFGRLRVLHASVVIPVLKAVLIMLCYTLPADYTRSKHGVKSHLYAPGIRRQAAGPARAEKPRQPPVAEPPAPQRQPGVSARRVRLPWRGPHRHVPHVVRPGAVRDAPRHAAVPPPGRGMRGRAGRGRRAGEAAGPAAVVSPIPTRRVELAGRGPGRQERCAIWSSRPRSWTGWAWGRRRWS